MKRFSLWGLVLCVALMGAFTSCKDKDKKEEPKKQEVVDPTPTPTPTPDDPTTGYENGHAWVDLGLDVLWATVNVGAGTATDPGIFYAWGETATKDNYMWSTYTHCDGAYNTLTKYCSNGTYGKDGFTDDLTVLEAEDDAAHVVWGGNWRMPTQVEWTELVANCTCTWKDAGEDGYTVAGCEVTGANGKKIFLPRYGYKNGTTWSSDDVDCMYWSSTLHSEPVNAWKFDCRKNDGAKANDYGNRYTGTLVRAVCPK